MVDLSVPYHIDRDLYPFIIEPESDADKDPALFRSISRPSAAYNKVSPAGAKVEAPRETEPRTRV